MIKHPEAVPPFIAAGVSSFLESWQQWGLEAAAALVAGVFALIAVLAVTINRSPRLSAATDAPEAEDAFADWMKRAGGSVLLVVGLFCAAALGWFLAIGLPMAFAGFLLLRSGRRGRRERDWRRTHAGLFMGPPARR
jgi:hypothetical protein